MRLIGIQRFDWSSQTEWMVELVIKHAFPDVTSIDWLFGTDNEYLDLKHGIDLTATLVHGQPLTAQAKVLSQTRYQTITIECESPTDKGDWSTCLAQFYIVIYASDNQTMDRWCIIDNARLALAHDKLPWGKSKNMVSGRSAFKFLEFSELLGNAPEAVIAYGGDWDIE